MQQLLISVYHTHFLNALTIDCFANFCRLYLDNILKKSPVTYVTGHIY